MSEQSMQPESMNINPFERNWMIISVVLLVVFATAVTIAAFALGIQVPAPYARVDPVAVKNGELPEWAEPGLRELAPGKYEAYVRSQTWAFVMDASAPPNAQNQLTVPVGSEVTFYVTSQDVQHGFKIMDTNITFMVLPGQVSTLTVHFDEARTYNVICHEYCGSAHAIMAGKIIVE